MSYDSLNYQIIDPSFVNHEDKLANEKEKVYDAMNKYGGYIQPANIQEGGYIQPANIQEGGYISPANVQKGGYISSGSGVKEGGFGAPAAMVISALIPSAIHMITHGISSFASLFAKKHHQVPQPQQQPEQQPEQEPEQEPVQQAEAKPVENEGARKQVAGSGLMKRFNEKLKDKEFVKHLSSFEKDLSITKNNPMKYYKAMGGAIGYGLIEGCGVQKADAITFINKYYKRKFGSDMGQKILHHDGKGKNLKHLTKANLIAPIILGRGIHVLTKNGMPQKEATEYSRLIAEHILKHRALRKVMKNPHKYGSIFKTLRHNIQKYDVPEDEEITKKVSPSMIKLILTKNKEKIPKVKNFDNASIQKAIEILQNHQQGQTEEGGNAVNTLKKVLAFGTLGLSSNIPGLAPNGSGLTLEDDLRGMQTGDTQIITGGMSEKGKNRMQKFISVLAPIVGATMVTGAMGMALKYGDPDSVSPNPIKIKDEGVQTGSGMIEGGLSPKARKRWIKVLQVLAPLTVAGLAGTAGILTARHIYNKHQNAKPDSSGTDYLNRYLHGASDPGFSSTDGKVASNTEMSTFIDHSKNDFSGSGISDKAKRRLGKFLKIAGPLSGVALTGLLGSLIHLGMKHPYVDGKPTAYKFNESDSPNGRVAAYDKVNPYEIHPHGTHPMIVTKQMKEY